MSNKKTMTLAEQLAVVRDDIGAEVPVPKAKKVPPKKSQKEKTPRTEAPAVNKPQKSTAAFTRPAMWKDPRKEEIKNDPTKPVFKPLTSSSIETCLDIVWRVVGSIFSWTGYEYYQPTVSTAVRSISEQKQREGFNRARALLTTTDEIIRECSVETGRHSVRPGISLAALFTLMSGYKASRVNENGEVSFAAVREMRDGSSVVMPVASAYEASTLEKYVKHFISQEVNQHPLDHAIKINDTITYPPLNTLSSVNDLNTRTLVPNIGITLVLGMFEYALFNRETGYPLLDCSRLTHKSLKWMVDTLQEFSNFMKNCPKEILKKSLPEDVDLDLVISIVHGQLEELVNYFMHCRAEKNWYLDKMKEGENRPTVVLQPLPKTKVVKERKPENVLYTNSKTSPEEAIENLRAEVEVEVEMGAPAFNRDVLNIAEVQLKQKLSKFNLGQPRTCEIYPGVIWEAIIGPLHHAFDFENTEEDISTVVIAPRRVNGLGLDYSKARSLLVSEFEDYFSVIDN